MGYGSWKAEDYVSYANSTGRNTISTSYTNADGSTSTYTSLNSSYNAQDIFKSRQLDPKLDPYHVMRECNDSDEPLNPYLPKDALANVTGDKLQGDVETAELYRDASDKFDIYHIAVDDSETCYNMYAPQIDSTWGKYLDSEHLRISRVDEIVDYIIDIVSNAADTTEMAPEIFKPNMEIGW